MRIALCARVSKRLDQTPEKTLLSRRNVTFRPFSGMKEAGNPPETAENVTESTFCNLAKAIGKHIGRPRVHRRRGG